MKDAGRLMLIAALTASLPAMAAKNPTKPAPAEAPATSPAVPDNGSGTTIVGDQESPIGLYITPWKNEYAEHSLDRPARFVDDELVPIDPDVFRRQIEFYKAISDDRKAQLAKDH